MSCAGKIKIYCITALLLVCASAAAAQKKILLIDSYNEGYEWSDAIIDSARQVLNGKTDLLITHMDTKRHGSEEEKIAAALKVKEQIKSYKPDLLIACDDNAAKYVIVPFYKDTAMPVVFCGINWDASIYGFPCNNVTGMLEVSVIHPLMAQMKKFAKGDRVVFIGNNNETNCKEAEMLKSHFNLNLDIKYVATFDEWKEAYLYAQNNGDMLIFINNAGISGWNDAEAKKFTLENAKIPSGSCHAFVSPFVLVTYAKLGSEQGTYAANTALRILDGVSPKEIPIVGNECGQFYVNLPIAQKLGIQFSPATMEVATLIKG